MNWYLLPWKRYAEFSGRSRRMEYWVFALINTVIVCVFYGIGIAQVIASHSFSPILILPILFAFAMIVPSLACGVRRLHDQDKSGWLLLLGFIPIVGGLIMLVLMLLSGTAGPNQYGPDPKAV